MERYEAYFFDFDGVLADTMEIKTEAFAQLFAPYGDDIRNKVMEHHRNHGGMTRANKFHHYYQHFLKMPISDEKLADLCKTFADIVVEKVVSAPPIPGAEDFLSTCRKNVRCFVISGTPTDEIREIVTRRNWSKYFLEVCGAPTSKDEHLKRLLHRYALWPKKCLFFGDALADFKAAQACGVPFIAILPNAEAPLLKSVSDIKWVRDFRSLNLCGKK
jgi:phosphoglycolate phosphatase-like HAD superfamily hydrolase